MAIVDNVKEDVMDEDKDFNGYDIIEVAVEVVEVAGKLVVGF